MPSTNIIVTLCEIGIWWYDSIAKTPNIDSIFHRRYHRQLCPFIQKTQTCPQSFHRLSDRYEDVTEGEPVHYVQKDKGARENYSGNAVLKKKGNCKIILWWILYNFGKKLFLWLTMQIARSLLLFMISFVSTPPPSTVSDLLLLYFESCQPQTLSWVFKYSGSGLVQMTS